MRIKYAEKSYIYIYNIFFFSSCRCLLMTWQVLNGWHKSFDVANSKCIYLVPITLTSLEGTKFKAYYSKFPNRSSEMLRRKIQYLSCALLLIGLLPLTTIARPFVLVLSQDDLSDPAAASNYPAAAEDTADFDDFPDSESKPDSVLDPGSWSPLFEPDPNYKSPNPNDDNDVIYYNGVSKMVEAASRGEFRVMEEAAAEIEAAAAQGQPHGQSVVGFFYSMGIGRERSEGKAFLHHHFAAQGGNMQSKMALAYTYYRQEVSSFLS